MKRKTRKHIAPQLELPEAEKAFNLAGETAKQPDPQVIKTHNEQATEGFTFDGEVSFSDDRI